MEEAVEKALGWEYIAGRKQTVKMEPYGRESCGEKAGMENEAIGQELGVEVRTEAKARRGGRADV